MEILPGDRFALQDGWPLGVEHFGQTGSLADLYWHYGIDANAIVAAAEGIAPGVPYPTPSNQCWPGGVPFVIFNIGMQMLQQPDKITILYSNDHEVRHVRLNQPHPAQVTPSWYGDSVGHYEGDTLVIDTVGIKIGPFAMVGMYGTPHSPALHVVERYRLLDYEAARQAEERGQRELSRFGRDPGLARNHDYKGNGPQLEFTVEDDGVFTKPWSTAVSYRRPLGEWQEMVCAENPNEYPMDGAPLCRRQTSRISENCRRLSRPVEID
jgi:hypothetical protein